MPGGRRVQQCKATVEFTVHEDWQIVVSSGSEREKFLRAFGDCGSLMYILYSSLRSVKRRNIVADLMQGNELANLRTVNPH